MLHCYKLFLCQRFEGGKVELSLEGEPFSLEKTKEGWVLIMRLVEQAFMLPRLFAPSRNCRIWKDEQGAVYLSLQVPDLLGYRTFCKYVRQMLSLAKEWKEIFAL
ncbi:MAG: hypothetical protein FJZ58_04425 [Chlamydiae bacterium]|nr:hypothetical protein [Chlamydiota bacterium]